MPINVDYVCTWASLVPVAELARARLYLCALLLTFQELIKFPLLHKYRLSVVHKVCQAWSKETSRIAWRYAIRVCVVEK